MTIDQGLWLLGALAVSLPYDAETDSWRLPVNSMDEPCQMPLDPLWMRGAPIGMYHCPYCGEMVVAGLPHPDFKDFDEEFAAAAEREGWSSDDVALPPDF